MKSLKFSIVEGPFTIHRLKPDAAIARGVLSAPFYTIVKTGEELSIVAPAGVVIESEKNEPGWVGLKIAGPLEFSETGILAGVATTLSQAGISIFAISTFDTDIILIKQESVKTAKAALTEAGHKFARKAKEEEAPTPAPAPMGYGAYRELLEKQLPAIRNLLAEKIGPATLAAMRGKGAIAVAVGSAYEFLPTAVRLVVPRQVFVDFCVENIDRLLPQAPAKPAPKPAPKPTPKPAKKAP